MVRTTKKTHKGGDVNLALILNSQVENIKNNFIFYELLLNYYILLYSRIEQTEETIKERFILIVVINKLHTMIIFMYANLEYIALEPPKEKKQQGGNIVLKIYDSTMLTILLFLAYNYMHVLRTSPIHKSDLQIRPIFESISRDLVDKSTNTLLKVVTDVQLRIDGIESEPESNSLFEHFFTTKGEMKKNPLNNYDQQGNYIPQNIINDPNFLVLAEKAMTEIFNNKEIDSNLLYLKKPHNVAPDDWKRTADIMLKKFDKQNELRKKVLEESIPDSRDYIQLLNYIHSPLCGSDNNGLICLELFSEEFKKEFAVPLQEYMSELADAVESRNLILSRNIGVIDNTIKTTGAVATGIAIYYNQKEALDLCKTALVLATNNTLSAVAWAAKNVLTTVNLLGVTTVAGPEVVDSIVLKADMAKESFYFRQLHYWDPAYFNLKKLITGMGPIDFYGKPDIIQILETTPYSEDVIERREQLTYTKMLERIGKRLIGWITKTAETIHAIPVTSQIKSIKSTIKTIAPRDSSKDDPFNYMLKHYEYEQNYDWQAILCIMLVLRGIFMFRIRALKLLQEGVNTINEDNLHNYINIVCPILLANGLNFLEIFRFLLNAPNEFYIQLYNALPNLPNLPNLRSNAQIVELSETDNLIRAPNQNLLRQIRSEPLMRQIRTRRIEGGYKRYKHTKTRKNKKK
uniref:Uncharacterized protein n=1 Tax=viral metagenome TaxID=1070528 RepID=A0A6C0IC63_9ZZZZ